MIVYFTIKCDLKELSIYIYLQYFQIAKTFSPQFLTLSEAQKVEQNAWVLYFKMLILEFPYIKNTICATMDIVYVRSQLWKVCPQEWDVRKSTWLKFCVQQTDGVTPALWNPIRTSKQSEKLTCSLSIPRAIWARSSLKLALCSLEIT